MRLKTSRAFSTCVGLIILIAAVVAAARIAIAQPNETPTAAAAPAATQAKPIPTASQLINVSACNPKLNVMQTGGGYLAGPGYNDYVNGWGYRGGYWPDAYGVAYYQAPVTTADPQLGIHYKNISHKTMTSIEFGLVVGSVLRAEVKDVGTFSPEAEIKHKFGLNPNVFPIQSALPQCIPLRITFADGTHWRNPSLPPKNQKIYINP